MLAKGEKDAGTILIQVLNRDGGSVLYERMPQLDGSRRFAPTKAQDNENKEEFENYLARRKAQDSDLWILEVDIAPADRFIASLNP